MFIGEEARGFIVYVHPEEVPDVYRFHPPAPGKKANGVREALFLFGDGRLQGVKDDLGAEENSGVDGLVIGDGLADVRDPFPLESHFRRVGQVDKPLRVKIHSQPTATRGKGRGKQPSDDPGIEKVVTHEKHKRFLDMRFGPQYGDPVRPGPLAILQETNIDALPLGEAPQKFFQDSGLISRHDRKVMKSGQAGAGQDSPDERNPSYLDEGLGSRFRCRPETSAPSGCNDECLDRPCLRFTAQPCCLRFSESGSPFSA